MIWVVSVKSDKAANKKRLFHDALMCPKCGSYEVSRIWNAEERKTKGFYCSVCSHFEKAIGRERLLPIEAK